MALLLLPFGAWLPRPAWRHAPLGARGTARIGAVSLFASSPEPEQFVCVYDSNREERFLQEVPIVFGAGSFASASELNEALVERGVDVTGWGSPFNGGATKSVSDLWEEIELGECDLRVDRLGLQRVLRVVKVRVRRPGHDETHLVESIQTFSDGRQRSRGLPLSEKMFPGETALEAAERGIVEELGSAIVEGSMRSSMPWPIELESNSLVAWDETRASKSYPHLISRYFLFQVDAVVHGLPSESFSTVEFDDRCSDHARDDAACRLKLAHTWDWVGLLEGANHASAVDAAALSEDSGTCVMYVSSDGAYVVSGSQQSRNCRP